MSGKFRKWSPALGAIALSAALLAPLTAPATAAPQTGAQPPAAARAEAIAPQTYRIVGIGDSLTAGYEHGFTLDSVPYGYVERVYEQALFRGRSSYVNYGLLGLRAGGLARWLDAAA
ncbi:hypothetical protein IDH44_25550, partial [Paenibacillus sp. IB182496]|nr:hypothetical protein [Paenibacillus sabuli]